jgi:hypothetical protein
MLKLIGMLLRIYHPPFRCSSCGYVGTADMRYRTLLPWLGLMTVALVLYVGFAGVYLWAGFYFLPNWLVGILFASTAAYFTFFASPDLSCPKCETCG